MASLCRLHERRYRSNRCSGNESRRMTLLDIDTVFESCIYGLRIIEVKMDKRNDYRKLRRYELLELLLAETERNEQLEAELAEARRQLSSREINIAESGSLAEAVLRLNGMFDAAISSCVQYEENIKRLNDRQLEINSEREEASIRRAAQIVESATERAARIEKEVIERCERIVDLACAEVDSFRERMKEL